MTDLAEWVAENWTLLVIPVAIFVASFVGLLWVRRQAYRLLRLGLARVKWPADLLTRHLNASSLLWSMLIATGLAVAISILPVMWKSIIGKGLWSLFVISFALTLANVISAVVEFSAPQYTLPPRVVSMTKNIVRTAILVFAVLVLLDTWGAPTTPLIFFIAVAVLLLFFAFRDVFPNLVAGFQLSASAPAKVGDYIRLESGEEGYVTEMSWKNTSLETLDEKIIILPNSRLLNSTIVNYGHPLKTASDPFRFYSRTHLIEITGSKAGNLRELADTLKTCPEGVIYYHTHRFLEEHHYLSPEPSNDFALWVGDILGEIVLAEKLASIDTFSFPTLTSLRDRLVSIMEEHLALNHDGRQALEGREFYFMKTVSVIFPTPYVAHDLREFVESVRRISLGSLYYHIFESRLRLSRGLNDFTIWLKDSLDEDELGEEIARLDPYTYTLEGLRSSLIQLIEKRIK
ncbi:MAG: mechanosensitive ion channel [Chloroflexi bacterium]|nr:mechanosensitive ion channel [Chloroflexota bacterium]